jgi:hypothetical protein
MPLFETEQVVCERPGTDYDELDQAIEREIEQAACGQILGLSVSRNDDSIVLRGHCRTYHASQLALQAALDVIEGSARLVNLIVVH